MRFLKSLEFPARKALLILGKCPPSKGGPCKLMQRKVFPPQKRSNPFSTPCANPPLPRGLGGFKKVGSRKKWANFFWGGGVPGFDFFPGILSIVFAPFGVFFGAQKTGANGDSPFLVAPLPLPRVFTTRGFKRRQQKERRETQRVF